MTSPPDTNCIFCAIVGGRASASIVDSDEFCTAFLDIDPINRRHLLVVSNEHASCLADLDPGVGARIFASAQRLAEALRHSSLPCDGINLLLSDGEVAGQEVPHLHLHVVPRARDDGFGFHFGTSSKQPPDRAELDRTAEFVRSALRR